MADVAADWTEHAPHGRTTLWRWDPVTAMAAIVLGALVFLTFVHVAFRGSVIA